MVLSIQSLNNSVKFGTLILLLILLLISLIIKSLELSIGVISGGIAGLVNFFLLTKVVSEITKDGKGLKGKTYLILLTSVRYMIICLSMLVGILISKACLIFVLTALILPQIVMVLTPLLGKD
ncbi:MAG: hypothetical protein A2149_04005 [Candidatus Schekmanbacteria bacterium RBG_16_38_11]|uniref:ATP synthase subunit I n=2 Tax=Candidatus Schekmaniibacteriota TaxID=1817811 RepID=A0A1F7R9R2_9BACT|nr:MAG: hypothetical protein A2042_08665 [Candidatus Schekmanbacteria bacterium GWA2_38_11]OGL44988.1 MAG: hypothetical protein A2149_04005 [Candidatus Schekmanbacteria bacterium RBG_16_38_11]